MAPSELDKIDTTLQDTIYALYEIQSAVYSYLGPQSQKVILQRLDQLVILLRELSNLSTNLPPNATPSLPPEILQYVDKGRNPDIYTREFVELVQKGNRYLKGKGKAFESFRDILAEQMITEGGFDEEVVKKVVKATGGNLEIKKETEK